MQWTSPKARARHRPPFAVIARFRIIWVSTHLTSGFLPHQLMRNFQGLSLLSGQCTLFCCCCCFSATGATGWQVTMRREVGAAGSYIAASAPRAPVHGVREPYIRGTSTAWCFGCARTRACPDRIRACGERVIYKGKRLISSPTRPRIRGNLVGEVWLETKCRIVSRIPLVTGAGCFLARQCHYTRIGVAQGGPEAMRRSCRDCGACFLRVQ